MTVEIIRPASEAEWLELRRKYVTGSQAAAVLSAHPYTSGYQLWAEKTGRASPVEQTGAMRRGNLLEPVVVQMLREERPDWLIQYPLNRTFYCDEGERTGATPDAFGTRPDQGELGNIQLKTASDWAFRQNWLDPETREVRLPLWIAIQAIIEARLTGAHWAVVAVMVVGHEIDLHIIDIPLDTKIMPAILEAVADFWTVVDSGAHPPINWLVDGKAVLDVYRDSDGSKADLSHVEGFDRLVAQYETAKREERAHAKDAEELKPRIIEALGNADWGETLNWEVKAPTTHRKAYEVKATSFRALRCKRKT